MAEILPIRFEEHLQLSNIGIKPSSISFRSVTMESERFICVREKCGDSQQVVIVDLLDKMHPIRKPVFAEAALMNPVSKVIALKAKNKADLTVTQSTLQIYNLEMKSKLKSYLIDGDLLFWKWVSLNTLGLVTEKSVFHWIMEGDSIPVKIFDRHTCLTDSQIINYRVDSKQLWMVVIGIAAVDKTVAGKMQLYSAERKCSQPIEGHAAAFVDFKFVDNPETSSLFCFAGVISQKARLHIVELGQPPNKNRPIEKKSIDIFFPVEGQNNFPVAMQTSSKYGMIYLITKLGYVHIFDIETGTCIFVNRISTDTIFVTAPYESAGGIIGVNRKGQVLSVTVEENNIIPYIINILKNPDLALRISSRCNLSGAEELFIQKFNSLFDDGKYYEAAKVAASSPREILRTPNIIQKFQKANNPPGQMSPILQYFGILLDQGQLNKFESIEICRPVLIQGKKDLLEKWLKENKLECSEELGDLVKNSDQSLALSVYLRANIPNKVVQCFAENGDFDKIVAYSKKVNYAPDYPFLIKKLLEHNPDKALQLSLLIVKQDISNIDLTSVVDIFMGKNLVQQCTSFLLEVLKEDRPIDGHLQTKLLEINLISAPQVADCILSNNMFSHYDRKHIASMCENVGLIQRALENYSEFGDIKRVIVHTDLIDEDWLVQYFGTLTVKDSLECLHILLGAGNKNINLVVKIAVKYYTQLTVEKLVALFEKFKCYEGLFHFLSPLVDSISDGEVHFKYIQVSCVTSQLKELERVCRVSNCYNAEQVKNYLKDVSLSDPKPLMIVCDRFNFDAELIIYFLKNNSIIHIESYVREINPSKLPFVIGTLLDVGCGEDAIKKILFGEKGDFSIEELVIQVEKRNRLDILLPWLERQVSEGMTDSIIHNTLAKIYIDCNLEAETFLKENEFYDSRLIGKYCEKGNPQLASIAYERGQCDSDLINLYNSHGLFKLEAKYLIKKKSLPLWAVALNNENPNKRSLVDQIIHSAILDTNDPEEICATVKAFMTANLLQDLLALLEQILLNHPDFSEERNLQNLLILTAIKVEHERVMNYVNKMNNYDAEDVANIAINNNLFEEGFTILKKFNQNTSAMQVLIENIKNLKRAYDFAIECNEPSLWNQLGVAQLQNGMVKESIESFIKANNPFSCKDVIKAADKKEYWDDLIRYLQMAAKASRDTFVECELVYFYAKTNRLSELEEFILTPNHADIEKVGDRCFENELYESARILYKNVSHFAKLASTLVLLKDYQNAVDSARKANNIETWKRVCFACIEGKEFRLAQMCALHIVVQANEVEDLISCYEEKGYFIQAISVLEAALGLERVHTGIFTELSILYCKYEPIKLKEHIEFFWSRINILKVLKSAEESSLWPELVFLYEKSEQFDTALSIIIEHPTVCWNESHFKELVAKTTSSDLLLKAIKFYVEYKPLLLNDLLITLSPKLDNAKAVCIIEKCSHLGLVKQYVRYIQYLNNNLINDALNNLLIEEDEFQELKTSIDAYDNYNTKSLIKKLENHQMIEFRRIAAYLYKKNLLWDNCIALCKRDRLFQDAMNFVAESKNAELAQCILQWFIEEDENDCFAACLFICYDILSPDIILEISWRHNLLDLAVPYMVQVAKDYISKVDKLEKLETHGQGVEEYGKNRLYCSPDNTSRSLQFFTPLAKGNVESKQ